MKKINPFAMGAQGASPDHPLDFNINIFRLEEWQVEAVHCAISTGALGKHDHWIRLSDLCRWIISNQPKFDDFDQWKIPISAFLQVSYFEDEQV